MAKLHFRYGAMNSGKTTDILQIAHNYEARDQWSLVAKPSVDTKGDRQLVSRIGASREVDVLLTPEQNPRHEVNRLIGERALTSSGCVLVDEAQFLKPPQVDNLFELSKIDDIPVIAFGLRTDFQTNSFPGSKRLMELADELAEIATICRCGSKARFNGRKINGLFVFEGDQVAIDGEDEVEYESLCGKCYLTKSTEQVNNTAAAEPITGYTEGNILGVEA